LMLLISMSSPFQRTNSAVIVIIFPKSNEEMYEYSALIIHHSVRLLGLVQGILQYGKM
jgi:hypothetical protein